MVKRLITIFMIISLVLSNVVVSYGATTKATVTDVSGVVKVKRSGSSKEFDAFKNMTISVGDKIRTGTGGTVTLVVDDENIIKAGKNTSFTVTDLSKVGSEPSSAYTIHYGSVTNDVNKKGFTKDSYKVNTSNTVMGVRGTVFEVAKRISEDGNEAISLVTLDGSVAVSDRELEKDGSNPLNEIGSVTASQQIIFSNEEEDSGEIVVLDISKLNAETLGWILANDEYLSNEQKEAVITTLVDAKKAEDEKIKSIEKVVEKNSNTGGKTVIMIGKENENSNSNSNEGGNTEVEIPDPVEPEVPDPIEPEVPDPIEPEVPDPIEPEVPDPIEPEIPDPIEPEIPDPIEPEVPDPIEPEVPDPVEPEVPDPIEPEIPDPIEPEENEGTYEINSVEDFVALNNVLNTSGSAVVSTVNINKDLNLTDVQDWKPAHLNGVTINGNGHTITNLLITEADEDLNVGLFATISNSMITDLNLDRINTDVSNAQNAGALAGVIYSDTIINNINVTYSTTQGNNAGGVAGLIHNNSLINNANIDSSTVQGNNVGGVVGECYGTLTDVSVSNGVIQGVSIVDDNSGGIVGVIRDNVIVNGSVKDTIISTFDSNVGGIAGYSYKSKFYNCDVSITGINTLGVFGGIVGFAQDTEISIVDVEILGKINAETAIGGVVGKGDNININFADIHVDVVSAPSVSGMVIGVASGNVNINELVVYVGYIQNYNKYNAGIVFDNTGIINITNAISINEYYGLTNTQNSANYNFTNSYYFNTLEETVEIDGLAKKTMDELKQSDLYLSWDTDKWNIIDGEIPKLK